MWDLYAQVRAAENAQLDVDMYLPRRPSELQRSV
jgi:hypothetical protein